MRAVRLLTLQQTAILPLFTLATLALLLTLPVLAPSFELTGRTIRGALDYEGASQFSVRPMALIHMVVPTVFGSNPTDYWGVWSNTEIWGYTGVLALGLAAYGVAVRCSRTRVFWLLLAAAAVLYMVGPFASLHGWVYAFAPLYDRVRAAGRAYMVVDLAVALLAGFGLNALMTPRNRWTARQYLVTRWGMIGVGAALIVVVAFVIPLMASRVLGVNDPTNRPVIALDNVNLLALWLLLGLGVLVAVWRGSLRGGWVAVAVFAVVLLDLFSATSPFNPTTSPILSGYAHEDTLTFLRERERTDGPFRIEVVTQHWQPDLALLARLDDIGGLFDPLALASYADYLTLARADRSSAMYRALNARYIISDNEQPAPALGYADVYRAADGIVVWEAPEPRPRAWIEGNAAPVLVAKRANNVVELTLPAGATGTLVISQAYYPGWSATVDGEAVEVERWQGALQAIELPPGAESVRLEFTPTRMTLWWACAGLAAVVWLAGLGLVARNRWRGKRVGLV